MKIMRKNPAKWHKYLLAKRPASSVRVSFGIILVSFLCSSCTIVPALFLRPRASYNSHRFQTAKTLGAGRTSLMPFAASVPNVELTQPVLFTPFSQRLYLPLDPSYVFTQQSLSRLSPKTEASTALLLGLNLQYGITPNLDIGIEASGSNMGGVFSFEPLFSNVSAQILAKYRFSAPTDDWAFASVAALGYVWGADNMSVRNVELSLPISRFFENDLFGIHITPRLAWVQSQTSYSFRAAISSIPVDSLLQLRFLLPTDTSFSRRYENILRTYTRDTTGTGIFVDNRIIPSLTVGAHIGRETQYHVEFGVSLIDGRIIPTGGVAVRFHF